MWKSNCVAISLLVVALTAVDFAETRRSFGGFGGRRISSGGVYKRPASYQHVNPAHLSYSGSHATAPKPTHTGGSHAYPSSGGLSGSNSGGGSHGYPSSGGLSGSNAGGGSHSYPSSNGQSGSNTGNNAASNIQNTHVNPVNSAYPSNNHGYPSSNGGVSGNNNNHGYPASNGLSGHGSNNQPPPYSPSSQYPNSHYQPNYHVNGVNSAPNGGHPMPYPPYQGPPPMYVQQVQSSGSRFGDILTGLAIYNLAQTAANKFSSSKHSAADNSNGKPNSATTADMACILRIIGENKTESVKVPCDIVSSFITVKSSIANTTIATTSNATAVTNVTTTADNKTNSMLTNSTEVVNGTTIDTNTTSTASTESTSSTTSMPTTTEGATAQIVSGSNESATVVTNTSTTVPNDANKTNITTPQPTITTIDDGSETTTPVTLPETTPSAADNTTVTVSQTMKTTQNGSDGNVTDAVATTATTPLPTNPTTVLSTNETTVSPTTTTPNTNALNSSNIQNAVDPIADKGPSIEVKPDYECVIEMYKNKSMTSNKVPCALLLQYAFQGTPTTPRPQPRTAAPPNSSHSAFASSEKLSAICLVFFWVRYNFV